MENPKLGNRSPSGKPPPRPSGSLLLDRGKLVQPIDEEGRPSTSEQAGGLENAKALLDQLKSVVDDAVFLDGDTFEGMKDLAYYSQKLQVGFVEYFHQGLQLASDISVQCFVFSDC